MAPTRELERFATRGQKQCGFRVPSNPAIPTFWEIPKFGVRHAWKRPSSHSSGKRAARAGKELPARVPGMARPENTSSEPATGAKPVTPKTPQLRPATSKAHRGWRLRLQARLQLQARLREAKRERGLNSRDQSPQFTRPNTLSKPHPRREAVRFPSSERAHWKRSSRSDAPLERRILRSTRAQPGN